MHQAIYAAVCIEKAHQCILEILLNIFRTFDLLTQKSNHLIFDHTHTD